ncbi:MAG: PilZ domain-containing protein [Thermodesulfobacteriota bacterium]
MARHIMILDRSASMRRILRTVLQATVNDAIVTEAQNVEEAVAKIEEGQFNLVLFSKESVDKEWLDYAQQRLSMPGRQQTHFALLSSSRNDDYLAELKSHGITEHLLIPCSPNSLGELVTRICSPFAMRAARRYSAPNTTAVVSQGANSFKAEVVNFSEGGMLCEFSANGQYNWAAPMMVTLDFDQDGAHTIVPGLYTLLARLMVVESNPDYTPSRVRLACRFLMVPEESKQKLATIFSTIEEHENKLGCDGGD